MEKNTNIYIVIIGLLLLVIILKDCTARRPVVIDNKYNYTTDTVYSKKQYEDMVKRIKGLEKILRETPPKKVVYYPVDNPGSTIIEKIPDSLLVYITDLTRENDSLRVAISDKYIKNYPTASKLINFKLTLDNMDITTLDINGQLAEANYPLYLNQYEYYWVDNTLKHNEVPQKKVKTPNQWNQLYFNGGYDFLNNKPLIGVDYYKTFYKFRLGAEANITVEPDPQLRTQLKLGYRLFR